MRKMLGMLAATVALVASCGSAAVAQPAFPSKPVHIFVPYPAGGGVDILARTLGDALSKDWGQSIVVENRPGAGGVVASQALAMSPPDGYTLIVVASGHATNPFLYPKIPYDTFKDFTPISLLATSPNILLVRADSPFKSLADVLSSARAKPGSRRRRARYGRRRGGGCRASSRSSTGYCRRSCPVGSASTAHGGCWRRSPASWSTAASPSWPSGSPGTGSTGGTGSPSKSPSATR